MFTIIAHRGDSAAAPENTFAAFDAALAGGFPHIETDVQLTADGVPVLLHDERLGRTLPGEGPISALTLAELQQLDAGAWFGGSSSSSGGGSGSGTTTPGQYAAQRVPTLSDTLQRYDGRAHIHLELKSQQEALPATVARVLSELGWLQACEEAVPPKPPPTTTTYLLGSIPGLTVTSFHLQQLKASMQLLPRVRHGWLVQEPTHECIEAAVAAGVQLLCPRANATTKEAIAAIRSAGLLVRSWGVRSIELLMHVVDCGVDGATVNWPSQADQAIQQHAAAGGR